MRSKEDFYDRIKEIRTVLHDPDNLKCSCPSLECEWHGKCQHCVAIHRYYKNHVPSCFQQFIKEKISSVLDLIEMTSTEKERISPEHWIYVREQDKFNK